jgi:hypothetical protein
MYQERVLNTKDFYISTNNGAKFSIRIFPRKAIRTDMSAQFLLFVLEFQIDYPTKLLWVNNTTSSSIS